MRREGQSKDRHRRRCRLVTVLVGVPRSSWASAAFEVGGESGRFRGESGGAADRSLIIPSASWLLNTGTSPRPVQIQSAPRRRRNRAICTVTAAGLRSPASWAARGMCPLLDLERGGVMSRLLAGFPLGRETAGIVAYNPLEMTASWTCTRSRSRKAVPVEIDAVNDSDNASISPTGVERRAGGGGGIHGDVVEFSDGGGGIGTLVRDD